MNASTKHTAFFGDRERSFDLLSDDGALIAELERLCACGIGEIFKTVASGSFSHATIGHVIRLGLIGAGEGAEDAAQLVRVYCAGPISASFPLSLSVLEAAWFGSSQSIADQLKETPTDA